MKKKIILLGGGGHCKVCIDIIHQIDQFEIIGILDLPSMVGEKVLDYHIFGTDDDIPKYVELGYSFFITLGQIKSVVARKTIFETLKRHNADILTIFSNSSQCSPHIQVGTGTIVMKNVIINAGAKIGENCILNNGSDIEHDTVIGNHTHVSTFSVINGGCRIGNEVFVGSNSTVSNNITIADGVVVGAGSVVIKDITAKGTFAGNPAKKI